MRIALLTNPSAGKTRQQIPFLLHQLTSYRRLIHVETPCPAAVPDALDLLSRQSIGLLIVNGDDGTLSEVLTSLLNDRAFGDQVPPIAIVQGGRTNMTANAIGVPRDVHGSIRQLVDVVRTGRLATAVAPQPVLRVEWSDDDEHQVRYGTFFGAGVIHRATRWMRCRLPAKRQGTAATAALVATLLARRLAPGRAGGIVSTDEIETSLDGESARRIPTQVLMATSLPRILLGLEPFWGE